MSGQIESFIGVVTNHVLHRFKIHTIIFYGKIIHYKILFKF